MWIPPFLNSEPDGCLRIENYLIMSIKSTDSLLIRDNGNEIAGAT